MTINIIYHVLSSTNIKDSGIIDLINLMMNFRHLGNKMYCFRPGGLQKPPDTKPGWVGVFRSRKRFLQVQKPRWSNEKKDFSFCKCRNLGGQRKKKILVSANAETSVVEGKNVILS